MAARHPLARPPPHTNTWYIKDWPPITRLLLHPLSAFQGSRQPKHSTDLQDVCVVSRPYPTLSFCLKYSCFIAKVMVDLINATPCFFRLPTSVYFKVISLACTGLPQPGIPIVIPSAQNPRFRVIAMFAQGVFAEPKLGRAPNSWQLNTFAHAVSRT